MNNPLNFVQIMRNPQAFLQQAMNNSQIMSNPISKMRLRCIKKAINKD